jgi:hypothetical protein
MIARRPRDILLSHEYSHQSRDQWANLPDLWGGGLAVWQDGASAKASSVALMPWQGLSSDQAMFFFS